MEPSPRLEVDETINTCDNENSKHEAASGDDALRLHAAEGVPQRRLPPFRLRLPLLKACSLVA